jgi:GT2 family glycosyltransferase
VIPNYNGFSLLKESLPFALDNLSSEDELIIVDNGSKDESLNWLEKQPVELISLDKNYGFTKACNEGAKLAKNDLVLFLNNDCLIPQNLLNNLKNFLLSNDLVATQPKVFRLNHSGNRKLTIEDDLEKIKEKSTIENIGYFIDLKYGRTKVVNRQVDLNNFDKKRYVYGLSGACLLVRKKDFLNLGGFDETFHSYLEDVDLSMRMTRNKMKFKPYLKGWCLHHHLSTSKKMGSYKFRQDLKNWIKVIHKNYSWNQKIKYFPFLFVERLRNLSGLLKNL